MAGKRSGCEAGVLLVDHPRGPVLLMSAPHLVLDGAVCAAELTGASEVIIVAHEAARETVRRAAAERRVATRSPCG
jgi:hypothetical protein